MVSIFHAPRNYPAVYAPYRDRFNFHDGRATWEASISGVPQKAIDLFAVHWLHLEVFNGGFWQYFFNSTATTLPEALAGFRAIGMPDVADIVAQAAARVGTPFPMDRDRRMAIVGPPDARMDFVDLDGVFYDLADTPKVFRRLPRFVPFADRYAQGDPA